MQIPRQPSCLTGPERKRHMRILHHVEVKRGDLKNVH